MINPFRKKQIEQKKLPQIEPNYAYKIKEVNLILNLHHGSLRRLLSADTPASREFKKRFNPVKIGRDWRILGHNLLIGMGTQNYIEPWRKESLSNSSE